MRQEALVLGEVGHEDSDGATDHGVLSHEDHAVATESLADLVHLLGGDLERAAAAESAGQRRGKATGGNKKYIVDGDHKDGLVVFQQALQLVEVFLLVGLDPHIFLLR